MIIFFLFFLLLLEKLNGDVLVPSSQFSMSMSPSFAEIEPEALFELQSIMKGILKNTSHIIYRQSLQPMDVHVLIQNFSQVTYNTHNSFVLKTINITFAVVGIFQESSSATGPTFMDSLVVNSFDRYENKNLFLASLQESKHESLHQILAAYLLKMSLTFSDQKPNTTETIPQNNEVLTPVDISLIVVSSMILSCMLLLLVLARVRRPKTITKEKAQSIQQRNSSSSRENTLSFDESFPGPEVNHSPFAHFPPIKVMDPPFRIFDPSPPNALRKSMSGITVPTSNLSRHDMDSSIEIIPLELNTTIDMTPDSSEAGEVSKSHSAGDLSSALALSGPLSTRWFDGSHASFSCDSHELFPSDFSSTGEHDGHFSVSNSYKGQSMEEWRRSILVVPRNNTPKWTIDSGLQVLGHSDDSSDDMDESRMTTI
jgi:hypothetical protein